jgi:hypothetical protein
MKTCGRWAVEPSLIAFAAIAPASMLRFGGVPRSDHSHLDVFHQYAQR